MTRVRERGEDVRRYIIENIEKHPSDVSRVTAEKFGITRQAVNKHLQRLVDEKAIADTGKTRSRIYKLCSILNWDKYYPISAELAEDLVWRNDIAPTLGQMPDNVLDIWHYGFTEMFNNAIDHSGATMIHVTMTKTAANTTMDIYDTGIGIFKKIQTAFGLLDERHAILELAKGKLTTDPKRHSGEGIFFSSRMFDRFSILAGGVFFSHQYGRAEDWVLDAGAAKSGTLVFMQLHNHTSRTTSKIFDLFASREDHGFNKTMVPVELAQYGNDKLISRSQAKRLLSRIDLFKTAIFDFSGVDAIGQAFADEIFRVFAQSHPEIELVAVKANSAVKRMIERAKSGGVAEAVKK